MIQLACIGEGAYLRHTAAMLHSALSHLPRDSVTVHLLAEALPGAEDQARLRSTLAPFGAGLMLHVPEAAALAPFPSGYFPRAIWLRTLLPELAPELERILYVDSDTIVTAPLLPLWETPLGDALLGAVPNPMYPFMPPYPQQRLGITAPAGYFNSGVLLMDLAAMRRDGFTDRVRQCARENPDFVYPDQDALNVVCRGRWRALHPRWNAQSTLFDLRPAELPFPAEVVAQARRQPAIVHFIGPFKPWHYLCRHPLRGLYFEHARQTPWGVPVPEGRSAYHFVLRQLPLAWIDRILRAERRLRRAGRRWLRRA